MIRRLILTAIAGAAVVFALAWSAWAAPPAGVRQMNEQMFVPTVEVGDGCSGQLIYSKRSAETGKVTTYVLTAKHCVSDMKASDRLAVTVPRYLKGKLVSEERYTAVVYAQAYTLDLALVKLLDEDRYFNPVARLAPLDPDLYEGEPVWAVGYPLRAGRVVTQGLFNAGFFLGVQGMNAQDYTRTSADIAPGSSGGGLYRMSAEGDYELIGVTSAGARGTPFISLFTSIYDIQKFLKDQAFVVYKDVYEAKTPD